MKPTELSHLDLTAAGYTKGQAGNIMATLCNNLPYTTKQAYATGVRLGKPAKYTVTLRYLKRLDVRRLCDEFIVKAKKNPSIKVSKWEELKKVAV